jgi:hypothetical protein
MPSPEEEQLWEAWLQIWIDQMIPAPTPNTVTREMVLKLLHKPVADTSLTTAQIARSIFIAPKQIEGNSPA